MACVCVFDLSQHGTWYHRQKGRVRPVRVSTEGCVVGRGGARRRGRGRGWTRFLVGQARSLSLSGLSRRLIYDCVRKRRGR